MSKDFVKRSISRLANRYPDHVTITLWGEHEVNLDTGLAAQEQVSFDVKGLMTPIEQSYRDHSGRPSRDYGGFFDLSEARFTFTRNQLPCEFDNKKVTVSQRGRTWEVDPTGYMADEDVIVLTLKEAS